MNLIRKNSAEGLHKSQVEGEFATAAFVCCVLPAKNFVKNKLMYMI